MQSTSSRRKIIAALAVVVPILVGLAIVAFAHELGSETNDEETTTRETEPRRETAIAPAAEGTPAPRVRLGEGAGGGARFDSSSLGSEPYAVVFVSTACAPIGDYLGKAAAELRTEGDAEAILAISADPAGDTPKAVAAYLAEHQLKGPPLHYLVGDEEELAGYWNAWGFKGPSSACPPSYPAHLVDGTGKNAGVIDLAPGGPPTILTDALAGMSK
jgi:cytochrome oxidase Cu insertion factor (SCO1/SenC/PrrC family)